MNSVLLGVALVLAAPVPVPEKVVAPKGPPPSYAIAVMKDGKLSLTQTVNVPQVRTETRTRTVLQQGKPVAVTYPVQVVVMQMSMRTTQIDKPRAYDTAGKEIDAGRLAELLKHETAVLVSGDGKPLDPFYLRTVKDGTLILAAGSGPVGTPFLPAPAVKPMPGQPPR